MQSMQISKWLDIPLNRNNSLWMQKEFVISLPGFITYEFKTTNSFSQIQNADSKFIIMNLYEFVKKKSVSVRKTSNLLI